LAENIEHVANSHLEQEPPIGRSLYTVYWYVQDQENLFCVCIMMQQVIFIQLQNIFGGIVVYS